MSCALHQSAAGSGIRDPGLGIRRFATRDMKAATARSSSRLRSNQSVIGSPEYRAPAADREAAVELETAVLERRVGRRQAMRRSPHETPLLRRRAIEAPVRG